MKELLVEDTPGLRASLACGLAELGCAVEQAADRPGGLRAAEQTQPDVREIDVMLPDCSGFELPARLHRCGIQTPALMLTALDVVEHRLVGFDAGADDYLPKSCDLRSNRIEVAVLQLRRAIDRPELPSRISTVRGQGCRLDA